MASPTGLELTMQFGWISSFSSSQGFNLSIIHNGIDILEINVLNSYLLFRDSKQIQRKFARVYSALTVYEMFEEV